MTVHTPKTQSAMSYYDVLNVKPYASDEEVKIAYLKLAKRFHPDHNPHNRRTSEHRFKMINEAYSHLKTKEKRQSYNRRMCISAHNDNIFGPNPSWLSTLATLFRPADKSQN